MNLIPKFAEIWQHSNGTHYMIVGVSNQGTKINGQWDKQRNHVLYQTISSEDKVYCRTLEDFQSSFKKVFST